ncbi:MAG: protein kinase [Planctomycetes bacterium]|nr:protein kinase [Planctomycetota bacterium]
MSTAATFQLPSGLEVVKLLGSGAKSHIWLVRQASDGKHYAMKRVVREEGEDYRFLAQTINEYQIACLLNHPNIRKIHKMDKIRSMFATREVRLMMEFCDGHTLRDKPPLSVGMAVGVYREVGLALAYMNDRGIVHADMKPRNIIVGQNGAIKVIDLGQSCEMGTIKKRIQGTPDFIAPEQVRRRPLDARTDVYNFGASLYWTVVGKPVPSCLPRGDSLSLPGREPFPDPAEVNPAVPPPLNKLVMDCVQQNPSDRPTSVREVVEQLGFIKNRFFPQSDSVSASREPLPANNPQQHNLVNVRCTGCKKIHLAPADIIGKAVACKNCGHVFIAAAVNDQSESPV